MDVPELSLPVKDLLAPLAAEAQRFGEGPEQLDDLGNMVVVLTVLGPGLRVEKIVASDELEDLRIKSVFRLES